VAQYSTIASAFTEFHLDRNHAGVRMIWDRLFGKAAGNAVGKMFKISVCALLALVAATQIASARHHHRDSDSTPGQFDYYLLSLSWSPAFCIQQPNSAECNGPRRYGFIVHGLWPQNERGWPQNCGGAEVPDAVVQGISDLMPARKLVYHEWSAHGTCSGLAPAAFFALVRRAYSSIAIPATFKSPSAAIEQAPDAIVNAFLQANPRLPAQSVVAACSGQGAPRLREMHVCFDRDLNARACSADALRGACRAPSVIVPPIR
jgi:ribonuclease T2